MTTVNLLNPFWGARQYTYFRLYPLGNGGANATGFSGNSLNGTGFAELAFASSPGGANLLPSATMTAPLLNVGANDFVDLWDSDGSTGIFVNSNDPAGSQGYIQAQFSSQTAVREVRVTSGFTSFFEPLRCVSLFSFAASNDGTNWDWLGTYSTTPWGANETRAFTINQAPVAGGRANSRVWLLKNETGLQRRIHEMEYATSAGGADIATGGFVAWTRTQNLQGIGSDAFDGNTNTYWQMFNIDVNDATLTYFFSSDPNPTHYRIGTKLGAADTLAWKLYYLTDGTNWVEADSRSETGWAGTSTFESRTYEIP